MIYGTSPDIQVVAGKAHSTDLLATHWLTHLNCSTSFIFSTLIIGSVQMVKLKAAATTDAVEKMNLEFKVLTVGKDGIKHRFICHAVKVRSQ